jgi:hypothetical protein
MFIYCRYKSNNSTHIIHTARNDVTLYFVAYSPNQKMFPTAIESNKIFNLSPVPFFQLWSITEKFEKLQSWLHVKWGLTKICSFVLEIKHVDGQVCPLGVHAWTSYEGYTICKCICYENTELNAMIEWLALLHHIWKFPSSKLCLETGYTMVFQSFPQSLQEIVC